MPGELNITATLLGPENRTVVGARSTDTSNELDLITMNYDIRVFSNETAYNLSFTQVNSMDVVDDYSITAEVSFTIKFTCLYMPWLNVTSWVVATLD